MKSLASISEKDIETIKIALNDSISDINMGLKGNLSNKRKEDLLQFKAKYARVMEKLRQNSSIYALGEGDLDIAASGLNDAIELLEEYLSSDDLDEQEKTDIMIYKNDCQRLVTLFSS